jgi:alpha-L-fucosidase
VNFDADQWVRTARDAGMKYIVITSKHHDGFAMFKSEASPYNIVDATPYGKDPLKELATACQKYGIRLGFYHSQAQDWHHPGGAYWGMESGEAHWDSALSRIPLEQYIDEKAYPQVKELLTHYGKIDIMWWDTPVGMTEPEAEKLHSLLALQPGIVENNRLYRPWKGDFSTPEQEIPPTGLDYDWEVCMTMNTSWGYKYYDQDWKSAKTLIQYLCDIASKGGNFLLNIGPNSLGEFPDSSLVRLSAIGNWMKVNGESVYGTTASPFFKLVWGRCTKKIWADSSRLYLHVFRWPDHHTLKVPGLKNNIRRIFLLDGSTPLSYSRSGDDILIDLPTSPPSYDNSVVVVDISGAPEVISNMPVQDEQGRLQLPSVMAFIHNAGYGELADLSEMSENGYIAGWSNPQTYIEWMFQLKRPGRYRIQGLFQSDSAASAVISGGLQDIHIKVPASEKPQEEFMEADLGIIEFNTAGQHKISWKPVAKKWAPVRLAGVVLEPADSE